MNKITCRFMGCGVLVIACSLASVTHAKENQGHHQSGIIGRVQAEQFNLPHVWQVRVSTEQHKLVTVVQTDEDGRFVVNLKPGTYHLTPFLAGEGKARLVGPSIPVTVEKKDFSVVELPLGFGPS